MSIIINKKYEIIENIGEGTFAKVFLGRNIKTKEDVAIKIQHKDMVAILKYEAKIYKHLRDISGIPQLRNFGTEVGFNYLILDYIDISLDKCNFNHREIIELIPKAINIIERIHERGIIHRDIKPDNFLIKKGKSELYLIDFGLSKSYLDKNKNHIEERKDRKLIGTAKYSSLNIHNGIEASRRDDIESICYTFVSLFNQQLPWDSTFKKYNNDSKTKQEIYQEIQNKKEKSLRWMYNIPGEFMTLLLYSRKLKFDEKPNYNYIRNLFVNLLNNY